MKFNIQYSIKKVLLPFIAFVMLFCGNIIINDT